MIVNHALPNNSFLLSVDIVPMMKSELVQAILTLSPFRVLFQHNANYHEYGLSSLRINWNSLIEQSVEKHTKRAPQYSVVLHVLNYLHVFFRSVTFQTHLIMSLNRLMATKFSTCTVKQYKSKHWSIRIWEV